MLALIRRLRSDTAGNFGIMTALLAVPILGAAGLAIDVSQALSLRTQLYGAADAAAVGAIAEKSMAVAEAMAMNGDGTIAVGSTDAQNIFFSQMHGEASELPLNLEITVTKAGGVIESRVDFSAVMPTTFMRVLGRENVTIGGTATARYQTPAFMDFYMLLDNTPSMGVAATEDDIARMKKATENGYQGTDPKRRGADKNCAFACHIVYENGQEDRDSYYNVALRERIPIRIDVVAEATAALMETAKRTRTVNNQFQMAAYTFGQKAQDAKLFKVAEITGNLDTVADATKNIKLMSIPYQNYDNDQQTSFDDALDRMGKEIKGSGGTGNSATDRQKIVFMVSDGVADHAKIGTCTSPRGKVNSTRCIEPIDTSYCAELKKRNIKIAVLYTTYLPLEDNGFWRDWVKPFDNQIGAKMEECASPGYYFQVSLEEGIEDAMMTLFRKIVSTPRITS